MSTLNKQGRTSSRRYPPPFPPTQQSTPNVAPSKWGISFLAGAAMLGTLLFGQPAAAQQAVYAPGDAIVTGFSGVKPLEGVSSPGGNPIDGFFIDPKGASMKIFGIVSPGSPPQGQMINAPSTFSVMARDIGQVFAVALDDNGDGQTQPNIYLGATSAYGLNIVVPGEAEPLRRSHGAPGATWMDGQFGTVKGGTPGSIWRVDGATGQVTLFATLPNNSGPGVGDIAYDKTSRQFFASDLDTGLIHRIGTDGTVMDSFDHGTMGRPTVGLSPIGDDGRVTNITSPAFDSNDRTTWGLTQPERRVWGLAINSGRLYYSVWSGPQVWSVGISASGFSNDARLEFDVSELQSSSPTDPMPIAHMVFDGSGTLYLAQRGGIEGRYDYSVFAKAGMSKAMRLHQNPQGMWMPEEYAIGFAPQQKFASGGIALGYGYDARGQSNGQCDATVWVTGDQLRNDPSHQFGEPAIVHGLQGNSTSLVQPANAPQQAYFVDYDGTFNDPEAEGHVGSVAIYQLCRNGAQNQPRYPQGEPSYNQDLTDGQPDRPYFPPDFPPDNPGETNNLRIDKTADGCKKVAMNTYSCGFTVTVTNQGPAVFSGNITVHDNAPAGTTLTNPGPFTCTAAWDCTAVGQTLNPGGSISFSVTTPVSKGPKMQCDVLNSARIVSPPGGSPQNTFPFDDAASATATINDPDCKNTPPDKPSLKIEKRFESCAKLANGNWRCRFGIRISNVSPTAAFGPGTFQFVDTPSAGTAAWILGGAAACNAGSSATAKNPMTCTFTGVTIPATYTSSWLPLYVEVPASQVKALGCKINNTIKITQGPVSNPGNGQSQASGSFNDPICSDKEKSNLAIEKKFIDCTMMGTDFICMYTINITNNGPGQFSGVITFTDTIHAGTSIVSTPECTGGSPTYNCKTPSVNLASGGSTSVHVTVKIPMGLAQAMQCKAPNAAQIVSPVNSDQNTNPGDDTSSVNPTIPRDCKPPSILSVEPPHSCPPGWRLNGEKCDPNTPPDCIPSKRNNYCRTPETPSTDCEPSRRNNYCCLPGQKWNGESCYTPETPKKPACEPNKRNNYCCPAGQKRNSDGCYTPYTPEPQKCGYRQHLSDGHCCLNGTEWNGRQCISSKPKPIVEIHKIRHCREGTTGIWPHCRSIIVKVCPPGMRGHYPHCRTVIKHCPPGTYGKYPRCHHVVEINPYRPSWGIRRPWMPYRPDGGSHRPWSNPLGGFPSHQVTPPSNNIPRFNMPRLNITPRFSSPLR
jgi:hypothetical protein